MARVITEIRHLVETENYAGALRRLHTASATTAAHPDVIGWATSCSCQCACSPSLPAPRSPSRGTESRGRLGAPGPVTHRDARNDWRVSLADYQTGLRDVRGQRTGAERHRRQSGSRSRLRGPRPKAWCVCQAAPSPASAGCRTSSSTSSRSPTRRSSVSSTPAATVPRNTGRHSIRRRPGGLMGGGRRAVPRHYRAPRPRNLGARHVPGRPG